MEEVLMKFRKKPVVIEAHQWFKNGDHPEDHSDRNWPGNEWEGLIVRSYTHSMVEDHWKCSECGKTAKEHGWVDTLEGGHVVCPGDWIITGVKGEHYPCKPDIFELTYEKVEE